MSIDADTLREMAGLLSDEDRDEMAIPSFLHRNPALRWMAWRRVAVVARLLDEVCPQGGRVLDFGCGTGVLFEAAATKAGEIVGVDLVLDAARLWKERRGLHKVRLLRPDEAEQELADRSVDVVVAAEVLEHIDVPGPTLAFFRRVLKPDGSLLVSLPTENRAYRFGRRLAGFDGHFHVHNASSLDKVIQDSGFRSERSRYIPLPGPLSIYLVARYSVAPG
jgi:2-polyprenyl-3-methyl-5-hydroxy-6-metoxy-1,4-benzoquinol methylase